MSSGRRSRLLDPSGCDDGRRSHRGKGSIEDDWGFHERPRPQAYLRRDKTSWASRAESRPPSRAAINVDRRDPRSGTPHPQICPSRTMQSNGPAAGHKNKSCHTAHCSAKEALSLVVGPGAPRPPNLAEDLPTRINKQKSEKETSTCLASPFSVSRLLVAIVQIKFAIASHTIQHVQSIVSVCDTAAWPSNGADVHAPLQAARSPSAGVRFCAIDFSYSAT